MAGEGALDDGYSASSAPPPILRSKETGAETSRTPTMATWAIGFSFSFSLIRSPTKFDRAAAELERWSEGSGNRSAAGVRGGRAGARALDVAGALQHAREVRFRRFDSRVGFDRDAAVNLQA